MFWKKMAFIPTQNVGTISGANLYIKVNHPFLSIMGVKIYNILITLDIRAQNQKDFSIMRTIKLLFISCVLGLFVSSAFAAEGIDFDFHGKMFQVFGSTNNNKSLAGKHKSGSTDFFSYNGQLNTKGFNEDDLEYFNTVGTTFGLSKARLRFEAKTQDNLAKFVYGLEVGTINWGDKEKDFGLSGDGITQETRFAYAEVKAPVENIDHIIRAGLQPTKISPWVWSETAAGLTYHGKSKSCKWMLGWYRGDEDSKSNSKDNNYFVIKTSGPLTPELELGLFLVYEHAGAETAEIAQENTSTKCQHQYDRDMYYLGTSFTFESNPFKGLFELIYQGGDIDFIDNDIKDLERNAMLMNLDLSFQLNEQLKLGFNSLYVTGDDNPNDLDAGNFDSIDVDVAVGMIIFKDSLVSSCDRFVSDAPYFMDKGLIHHALTAEYKLAKKHTFFTAIRSLSLAKDYVDDNKQESSIGTELDFKYAYKLNKNVKLRLEAACLIPGAASDLMTADDKEADTIFNVASGIQFSF